MLSEAVSEGWHADDESLFMGPWLKSEYALPALPELVDLRRGRDRDCPIISVSLGARRESSPEITCMQNQEVHVRMDCGLSWSAFRFWLALRHDNCMDPQLKSIIEVGCCESGAEPVVCTTASFLVGNRWTCVMEMC